MHTAVAVDDSVPTHTGGPHVMVGPPHAGGKDRRVRDRLWLDATEPEPTEFTRQQERADRNSEPVDLAQTPVKVDDRQPERVLPVTEADAAVRAGACSPTVKSVRHAFLGSTPGRLSAGLIMAASCRIA